MSNQVKTIRARLAILATLQLILFVSTFGQLQSSAAQGSYAISQIANSIPEISDLPSPQMSVTILGFSSESESCKGMAQTDCEVKVHYDVDSPLGEGKVVLYASGPQYDNHMVGETVIDPQTTKKTIDQNLKASEPGFYTVTAVILDSGNQVAASNTSGFYTAFPAERGELATDLKTVNPKKKQQEIPVVKRFTQPKKQIQITPIPANVTLKQEIQGDSVANISQRVQPQDSQFRYVETPKPVQQLQKQQTVSAPKQTTAPTKSGKPETQPLQTPTPAPAQQQKRIVNPGDNRFKVTRGYQVTCDFYPDTSRMSKKAQEMFGKTICYEVKI